MIRKIIFDIDNTLIDWEDENYFYAVTYACKKNNIEYSAELQMNIKDAVDNYEKYEEYYKKDKMHELICKFTKEKLDFKYTEDIIEYFSNCVPKELEEGITETLKYLSNKYELVALTNWFKEEQEKRMKKAGICNLFKTIYGTEQIKIKPNIEAFITACNGLDVNECVMVGDNFSIDIEGSLNAGLNAIYLNKKNKKFTVKPEYINKIHEIKNINELLKIL